jgi:hypothetical protein
MGQVSALGVRDDVSIAKTMAEATRKRVPIVREM